MKRQTSELKRLLVALCGLLLVSSIWLAIISFQISPAKAETIEEVYSCVTGTGSNVRIDGLYPSATTYSALGQTFHVSKDCKPKNMTVACDENGAYLNDGFFQGRITTCIQSGSFFYPNVSNIIATTRFYSREEFQGVWAPHNLTILQDVVLHTGVQYAFCLYSYNGSWSTSVGYRLYVRHGGSNTDANENWVQYYNGGWLEATIDNYLQVYGDTEFDKLVSSNEGCSNNENGASATFSCLWTAQGTVTCSGYIFSYGLSGSMQNDTWVQFSETNNTWANVSKLINFPASALGQPIYYQWFANSSVNAWYSSTLKSFTLQATVTYYFNTGGLVERNDTAFSNGTQTTYNTLTHVSMQALCASGYGFLSWNWTNSVGSNTSNPLIYDIINQTTLWCYFAPIGAGGAPFIAAAFNWTPTNPAPNQEIIFNGTYSQSSSAITDYSWDFGDGNVTSGMYSTITHNYPVNQTYLIKLTVTSAAGYSSIIQGLTVGWGENLTIIPPYIYASFQWIPANPPLNTTINFNGSLSSSSSSITAYDWDFGDGNLTMGINSVISHTYFANATFMVTLNVTSAVGTSSIMLPVVVGWGENVTFPSVPSAPVVSGEGGIIGTKKQLDVIIGTAAVTTYWWQSTFDVEIFITNKGQAAEDVIFYWRITTSDKQVVSSGKQTIFISGFDKKTIAIPVSMLSSGNYTVEVEAIKPTRVFAVQALSIFPAIILGDFVQTVLVLCVAVLLVIAVWVKKNK